jgi:hypothetical protein
MRYVGRQFSVTDCRKFLNDCPLTAEMKLELKNRSLCGLTTLCFRTVFRELCRIYNGKTITRQSRKRPETARNFERKTVMTEKRINFAATNILKGETARQFIASIFYVRIINVTMRFQYPCVER